MRVLVNSPTRRIATLMCVVSILGGLVYWRGWAQAWMSNVVVGALTVALTVTVVEEAFRREDQARIAPRRDAVMRSIGFAFSPLIGGIAVDYASTHLDTYKPVPLDSGSMIELWSEERGARDAALADISGSPLLLQEGELFLASLELIRARDRDVIEPAVVAAMDEYMADVRRARRLFDVPKQLDLHERDNREAVTQAVVRAAGEFLAVFRDYAPDFRDPMDAPRAQALQDHHDRLLQTRDALRTQTNGNE